MEFVERLRGEMKFASVQALVDQIRQDAERAREVLKD
jgi:FAD synthase